MENKKIEPIDLKEFLIGITTDSRGWENPIIFEEESKENDT